MLNVIARWCHNVAPRNSAVDDCTCGFRHMTSRLSTGSTVRRKIPDTQTVPCGGQPGLLGQKRPVDFPRLRRRARCDGVRLVQTDSNSRETSRVL